MLRHPTWQTRRDAWMKLSSGARGGAIAAALATEQNANVLDSALEGVRIWIEGCKDSESLAEAVSAHILTSLVQRGLGASRASTCKRGRSAVEAALARPETRQGTIEALVAGLGADVRRGGGKLPATCARLIAAEMSEEKHSEVRGLDVGVVGKLFDAASSDCRLAAAELVLALESNDAGEAAAWLEQLGPSAQKAVDRARGSLASSSKESIASSSDGPTLPCPTPAVVAEETELLPPTKEEEEPAASWATADEFFDEILAVPDEEGTTWLAKLKSTAWLERKESMEAIGKGFKEKKIPDDMKDAIAVSPMFEETISAVATKAAKEAHAKVATIAIGTLASIIEGVGAACIPSASRAVFGSGEEGEVYALHRAKDKRLATLVSEVLRALLAADAWLALDDARAIAAVSETLGGKKKLPPFGRAAVLEWIGDIRGLPPKRRTLTFEPYVKVALADANDANSALRQAAASALATLKLLGAGNVGADDDKRLLAKIEELVQERQSYFVAAPTAAKKKKKTSNKAAAAPSAGSRITKKQPVEQEAAGVKQPAAVAKKSAEPPPRRLPPPSRQPVKSKEEESSDACKPFLRRRRRPEEPEWRMVALKEVAPTSTRSALSDTKDKDSWKRRRAALEKIVASCGKVARSTDQALEPTKEARQLVVDLRPRLADAQVKLRPLACEAIAALVAAIEPRDAAARIGAKLAVRTVLAAVLDTSRGVRGPALAALSAVLGEDADRAICGKAFADAAPHFAAALVGNASPAAKPELLEWLLVRTNKSLSTAHSADLDQALVPALITLMSDKAKETRDASYNCLVALASVGAVTKLAVTNTLRDVAPAAKRSLQPRLDVLVYSTTPLALHDDHLENGSQLSKTVVEDSRQPGKAVNSACPPTKAVDSPCPPTKAVVAADSVAKEAPTVPASKDVFPKVVKNSELAAKLAAAKRKEATATAPADLPPSSSIRPQPQSTLRPPSPPPAEVSQPTPVEASPPPRIEVQSVVAPQSPKEKEPEAIEASPVVFEKPPRLSVDIPVAGATDQLARKTDTNSPPQRAAASQKKKDPEGIREEEPSADSDMSRFSELGMVAEVPAVFHFNVDIDEDDKRDSGESESSFDAGANPEEIMTEAAATLGKLVLDDECKRALKAVVHFARTNKGLRQFADNDRLASTLASVVDAAIDRLALGLRGGGKRDAQHSRFARLSLAAALACVKASPMRRLAVRDVLRVSTRRAAQPELENDLELRTALNDLAVSAGLDTARPQAIAAVLDLFAENCDEKTKNRAMIDGQLARIVHLATTDDAAWRISGLDQIDVAGLLTPLIDATHGLIDKVIDDDDDVLVLVGRNQLALDSAKTVLVFLTGAFGLEVVVAAAERAKLPQRGPLLDFARAIANDDDLPSDEPPSTTSTNQNNHVQDDYKARGRRRRSVLTTTSSENHASSGVGDLARRLNDVKAASVARMQQQSAKSGGGTTRTSTDTSTSDRIAQLRARLSATTKATATR